LTDGAAATGVAVLLSSDGWALTATAAVANADVVRVRLSDGRTPWARVLRRVPTLGVALLGVAAGRLDALPVRPTSVRAGEAVFSVLPSGAPGAPGAPGGGGVGIREHTVTDSRPTAVALMQAPAVPPGTPIVDAWANGAALTVAALGHERRPLVPLSAALEALGARVRTPPPPPEAGPAPPPGPTR